MSAMGHEQTSRRDCDKIGCDKIDCDKIDCDKNGCDVLVGKQLMRPAFGLPDGRCVIPYPQPLTQANPTKEACHV